MAVLKTTTGRGRRGRFRTFAFWRKTIAGFAFATVAVSLVWHTGTGTPSAWGVSSIAAVCPLGSLEALLAGRNFMLHPVLLLVAAVVAALVLGKAFCAWLCPTPYVQKLLGRKPKRAGGDEGHELAEDSPHADEATSRAAVADAGEASPGAAEAAALAPVGGARDGVRIDSRHAALGGALASSLVFGFPVFCLVCPVGLTLGTVIGVWHLLQYNEVSWMLVAMPVVLVLELGVFRKWCSTLCPISALVSLVSAGNRTCKPGVDAGKCLRTHGVDCRECVERCPEQVDPHTSMIPECSKCGECVAGCPAHAIEMKLLQTFGKAEELD